jgi:5-methylcytosine-specific restriction endonuclease McrA
MTANDFWEEEFGDRMEANDFAGRSVYKKEYGVRSDHGWTIDHILPLAMNGSDTWANSQITHWKTNEEKADKNTFVTNSRLFQVKKVENRFDEDKMANYPYIRCHKEYCIIIIG